MDMLVERAVEKLPSFARNRSVDKYIQKSPQPKSKDILSGDGESPLKISLNVLVLPFR
jgi:hypothetical protein